MPVFDYKAKNPQGHTIEGAVEAPDDTVAADVLIGKELVILTLKQRRSALTNMISKPAFLNRVTMKDLVVFSRQLSVMISANLTLVEALKILVKQTENERLKEIISQIADEVNGGATLSQAMGHFSNVFDNFFINMVRSGETSGRLDEVLNYLADQQERDYDLMSRIKGAMIYPIFIICALVVVGGIMMVVVVPRLTAVLIETGQDLPFATRALIATSDFLKHYWWALIVGVAGLVAGVKALIKKSQQFKSYMDFFKLKIPVFGKLLRRIYLVRFTRSFGTLLEGGVPLTFALEVVAEVVGNDLYKNLILQTVKEVEDGHSLTTVLAQSKEVPNMMTNMLAAGEDTGKVNLVLERLTDFYTRDINALVDNLVSLIEPIIMIVLGVAVGIIVAAIILPMYNIASGF